MSILLPQGAHWLANNWISMGFFEDARAFLEGAGSLGTDIQFCLDADVDTLDLRQADEVQLTALRHLVDAVIQKNTREQGRDWADPAQLPTYLSKLRELRDLLQRSPPAPSEGELRWDSLSFKYGAEWAPDAPGGLDILGIAADGTVRYENRVAGQARTAAGRVELRTFHELLQSLHALGFPKLPAAAIPPGGSIIEIRLTGPNADDVALMDYFAAVGWPGYRDVIRQLTAWTTWLRKNDPSQSPPAGLLPE